MKFFLIFRFLENKFSSSGSSSGLGRRFFQLFIFLSLLKYDKNSNSVEPYAFTDNFDKQSINKMSNNVVTWNILIIWNNLCRKDMQVDNWYFVLMQDE